MDMPTALDVGRNAFYMALTTSAPILIVGLLVGLTISIIQSVTQLQEQTLTFVPKILVIFVSLVLLLPFMMTTLIEFAQQLFDRIGTLG